MKNALVILFSALSFAIVGCDNWHLAQVTFSKSITRVGDIAIGSFEWNVGHFPSNVLEQFTNPKNSVFLVFCDQKAFGGGTPNAEVPRDACIKLPENYPIAPELEFIDPAQGMDRLAPRVKITINPTTNTILQSFSVKATKATESGKSVIIVMQVCRLLEGQSDFKNQAVCLPGPDGGSFGFFIAP